MEDISSICRTCLHQCDSDDLFVIDAMYLISSEVKLMDVLIKHTEIEENESYPQKICSQCVVKAQQAYCFFEQCNESNYILSQLSEKLEETIVDTEEQNCKFEIITIKNEDREDVEIKIIFDNNDSPKSLESDEDYGQVDNNDNKFSIDHKSSLNTDPCFPMIKCKFCQTEVEAEQFEEHKISLGHFESSDRIMCPYCNLTSLNITNFKNHLRTHNPKDTKKYICTVCNKIFKWKKNYHSHMKVHEKSEEEKVMCPDCGLLLSNIMALQIHRGREHVKALVSSEWTCQYCTTPTIFKHISDFKKHIKEIHCEKDFHCIICGMDCEDKRTLYYHEQLHLNDFGIECDYCHKKLLTEEKLVLHQRIHKYVKKKHVCNICCKGFKQLDKLEAHVRIHTGEKPFKCDICGKAFNHQNNLWHHNRLHTGDTPYKCLFCCKEFSNSHSLRKHMRHHENEKLEEYILT